MSQTTGDDSFPRKTAQASFAGFALPTSNTTYTPNQFFDVCLPHGSRGCLRLVALMIRKTLGWCDEHGRPQQERIRLSYADFLAAGISRGMVKASVEEAISGRFIRCVKEGRPKSAGQAAVSAEYELVWDENPRYVKDPVLFRGFFAGEGNRTYIPNQFFDHVVKNEPLGVVKVVGAIARFSIGFSTKWGHRRTFAVVSYLGIQRYTKLADRSTLSSALQIALRNNYIQLVEAGYFDPHGGVDSRRATYALKWVNRASESHIGSKTRPEEMGHQKSVQNPDRDRSENPIGHRFENPTGLQIKQNKTLKQQQDAVSSNRDARRESTHAAAELLQDEGFDHATADYLATVYSIDRIIRQIDVVDQRRAKRNRLGMLRRAIEQDWAVPTEKRSKKLGAPNFGTDESAVDFDSAIEETRRRLSADSSSTST